VSGAAKLRQLSWRVIRCVGLWFSGRIFMSHGGREMSVRCGDGEEPGA